MADGGNPPDPEVLTGPRILARPGYEKGVSQRIPLGRWGDPAEAGGVIAFMVSKASSYMNGHVLVVDGGLTAGMPVMAEELLAELR